MGIVENNLMAQHGISYLKFDEAIGNPTDKMDDTRVINLTNVIREDSPFGGFMYRFVGGYMQMPRVIPLTPFSVRLRLMLISNPIEDYAYAYIFDQRGWSGHGSGWAFIQGRATINGQYDLQNCTSQQIRGHIGVTMEVEKWYDVLLTFDGDAELKVFFLGEEVEPVSYNHFTPTLALAQSNVDLRIGNHLQGTEPAYFKLDTFEVYDKVLTPYDFATGYIAYKAPDGKVYAPYGRKVRLLPNDSTATVRDSGYPIQVLDEHRGIDLNYTTDTINTPAYLVSSIGNYKVYSASLPIDFNGLEGNTSNRYLIRHGGSYKYFSTTGGWISIGSSITTDNITDTTMNDLSTVSQQALKLLTGVKELYVISNNTSNDDITIDVRVDGFTMSELLGKNCQVVYVSNTGKVVEVTKEVEPIDVDTILDGAELVLTKEKDIPVSVSYESNDVSIYRKLGDSADYGKLHDPQKEARPFIRANWTPLDELDRPDIVFSSVLETADSSENAKLEATGVAKKTRYTTEVNITPIHLKEIIPRISLRHPETEFRFALTQDHRTWHVRQGSNTQTFSVISDIHEKGMDIEEIAELSENRLKQLTALNYLVTVGVKTSERSYHVETLDFIQVTEDVPLETPAFTLPDVYIINSKVVLNLEFLGSVLKGSLEDPDRGLIKYKVKLNGEQYIPYDEELEWSDWLQADQSIFIQLNSSDVVIGGNNTLIIEVEDYFGNEYSETFQFEGEYPGLLFKDPSNGYYTTDIGDIIKYLEVGVLQQGQTSPQFEIHLVNNNPFEIYDTTLVGELNSNGIRIEFSKVGMPFMSEYELKFEDIITYKEVRPFFIRLVTESNAQITQNGLFKITAESKMVE